ncbi:MAG: YggU family protein [Proteobacteria bacterium]|nr:YggU family protein [Pseudomonadota bacterium]
MLYFRKSSEGIIFKVYILPRSSKNMIAGLFGDALKIKLTAAPVDGSANSMCIKYLAKILSVSPSRLEIVSGHTGKTKYILIKNDKTVLSSSPEAIMSKMDGLLKSSSTV